MSDEPLDEWFYLALERRPTLETAAEADVDRWEWFKGGLWQPLDPEPYAAETGNFSVPKRVSQKPAASPLARKGYWECGLDAMGRLRVLREYRGNRKPSVRLYLHLPGRIRIVSYGDERASAPVSGVQELTLDRQGRVLGKRTYGNLFGFPTKLTPATIAAHQRSSTAVRTQRRFVWNGAQLARIEVQAVAGRRRWLLDYGFEYAPNGKLTRIWRPVGDDEHEVVWPKGRRR